MTLLFLGMKVIGKSESWIVICLDAHFDLI
jgi:hypothetical protein